MAFPVSIHAFRGEGDDCGPCTEETPECFNPRLPGGRRPAAPRDEPPAPQFQSTPSGGKATEGVLQHMLDITVSIHAFRGEGDSCSDRRADAGRGFNPRLPGGRRLDPILQYARHPNRFNPRLPGGRRPMTRLDTTWKEMFQSTPSGGKATLTRLAVASSMDVSIHAFRGEGDFTR